MYITYEMNQKFYVKDEYDRKKPLKEIKEVYESFSGWYWFITEKYGQDGSDLMEGYAYGLVIGNEAEWGDVYLPELESLKPRVWKVPKMNWFSISHVITKSE